MELYAHCARNVYVLKSVKNQTNYLHQTSLKNRTQAHGITKITILHHTTYGKVKMKILLILYIKYKFQLNYVGRFGRYMNKDRVCFLANAMHLRDALISLISTQHQFQLIDCKSVCDLNQITIDNITFNSTNSINVGCTEKQLNAIRLRKYKQQLFTCQNK